MPPRCGMHTTLTPCCLHDVTFFSLKKPRSDPYNLGTSSEGLLVAFQRNNHVLFVDGISVQHFILRDQAARAFGEEDFVAELDRGLHLTAFDEVRVGLENRIDLLGSWNLFAVEHAAARLIDHTRAQSTKVLDLLARFRDSQIGDHIFAARLAGPPERRSCTFDDLLGDADQLTVCSGLMILALP